eukprot:TRINITY_DN14644_c0_g2_i2.p1 TRINITY_DN14644_c0_g2~~TRINITY_DN14644_c0_g2_i2.p1  ORF type:complete len:345 (+),score=37.55 TRINITY_DN14644_c0_g2_i2:77-1111(+)
MRWCTSPLKISLFLQSLIFPCALARFLTLRRASSRTGLGDSPKSAERQLDLVVSRLPSDDTSWLRNFSGTRKVLMVEPSESGPLTGSRDLHDAIQMTKRRTLRNGSTRECGGYLQYIVDTYDNLPQVALFMQGAPLCKPKGKHEHFDWHTDSAFYNSVASIMDDPGRVRYCSMNYRYMNWHSSGSSVAWYVRGWREQLGKQPNLRFHELHQLLGMLPDNGTACYCCAQFAVSRDRIRAYSRNFYRQLLDFVSEDEESGTDPSANERCALLERTWHVLFSGFVNCPVEQSSCRLLYQLGSGDTGNDVRVLSEAEMQELQNAEVDSLRSGDELSDAEALALQNAMV